MNRYWPMERGFVLTSPFGPREGGFHWGADFGREGGSGGLPVYAMQGGTVHYAGRATGFGLWVTIDHPTEDGGGYTVYGHVVPEVVSGQRVEAGQRIARINPDRATNGDVAPHLHVEVHRYTWVPAPSPDRLDPLPWLKGAAYPEGGQTVDSLFADVSYFQVPVDDSYPYRIFSFRSNDGTFRDPHFAHNYTWAARQADAGKLACFIVYFYWRPNWAETVVTHKDMVEAAGGPHPRMITMIDVESGGNPGGDQSDGINRAYWAAAEWLGDKRRVIGYANTPDFNNMWRTRPDGLRIIGAGYGRNPRLPGQIAHQYTDGNGCGGGLPEGCPPFGNCDMNVANGLSPEEFAAACGIGGDDMAFLDETITNWAGHTVTVRDVLKYVDQYNGLILDQLVGPGARERGGDPTRWEILGNRTVVEALAIIGETLGIEGFGTAEGKRNATVATPMAGAQADARMPEGGK
ncbi:M23 family metallopeptidase [Nocardia sp. CDC159]|uniref:M23 family metallopeptidase n=1 Tax=Nocardia pulmonis TaxID=2951408 RepID=A0A9X2EFJ9_9NOCA|nr:MULTISPECIES: M23 family metallopeptidase [Nocardia]MCM6778023.1 M23 family metallopeptidase [Nocardia pulmonis]MCM6790806.1 M23 family metallopeptidase [Nocardia sp. CDC159]